MPDTCRQITAQRRYNGGTREHNAPPSLLHIKSHLLEDVSGYDPVGVHIGILSAGFALQRLPQDVPHLEEVLRTSPTDPEQGGLLQGDCGSLGGSPAVLGLEWNGQI